MALISINNTRAAYNILKKRISTTVKAFNVFVHIAFTLLYIYYLIFNNEAFNIYIYSILLAVNIASFIFMFVFKTTKEDDSRAKFKKRQNKLLAKNITNVFKYGAKIFAVVYTILEMNESTSELTKLLTYFSAFLTVVLLLFEILANVVNKYINLFIIGIEKDMNESKVVSIYKKLTKDDSNPNLNYSKGEEKIIDTLNKEIEAMDIASEKRKLNIIEKKILAVTITNNEKKVSKLIGKTDKIVELLEKSQDKYSNDNNSLKLSKLNDYIDLLYDYVYGNYKEINEENVISMLGVLNYYVSSKKNEDKKSLISNIDESNVLESSLEKTKHTLENYYQWKKKSK